jgi:F-type H+-transporting ATPase subunit delta
MAELATIARPYAEALFKASSNGNVAGLSALSAEMQALAAVAGNTQLRQYADSPKTTSDQVLKLIDSVLKTPLSQPVKNLLAAMVDNGRLAALPEVAAQFQTLVNSRSGVSDAIVYSAFPIDAPQLADVVTSLEKRFGRKLNASVVVEPELIGGVRVVVGDEVLDTSVKARLEQMKVALTA